MAYPAAYRPGAGDYGGGKAFKPPTVPKAPKVPNFVPSTRPIGITPNPANLPSLPARGAGMVLPRIVGRVVPWLGLGLAAWELWNWWQSTETVQYPGFSLSCEVPGPCGYDATAAFNYSWACPLVPCTEASWQYLTVPNDIPADATAFGVFEYNEVLHPETGDVVARVGVQKQRWERNPGFEGDWAPEGETRVWAPLPLAEPVVPPWLDPFELPILQPVPDPVPPPWREATPDPNEPDAQPTGREFEHPRPFVVTPNRTRDPRNRPWVRRDPKPRPRPPGDPRTDDEDDDDEPPVPKVFPPIRVKPKRKPGDKADPFDPDWTDPDPSPVGLPPIVILPPGSPPVTVETTVITERGVSWEKPRERRTRARRKEKEKKLFIRSVVGNVPLAVINLFTESLDFIDALWKAIPDRLRPFRKRGDYTGKLQDLWDHLDETPIDQAVASFINNQFEDWLFALGSTQVAQASRQVGLTTGLDRATRLGGDFASEVADGGPPIPELYVDPVTGDWSIVAGGLDPVVIAQGNAGSGQTFGDLFGD